MFKRAQGGSDFNLDRVVALCHLCHAQADAPYRRGWAGRWVSGRDLVRVELQPPVS